MALALPTAKLPASSQSPQCLVIYGGPKIGKTSIITALADSLLVEIEPNGAAYIEAVKIDFDRIERFLWLEEELKKGIVKYRYGILDTLDQLESWCEAEATRRYKASDIGKNFAGKSVLELAKGGGYFHLRNVYYEYFNRFRLMFPRTIMIGHIRDSMLAGPESSSDQVATKDLDLTGKIRNMTCAYADAIGHCYRDKDGKFKMSFNTSDKVQCGSRCAHLAGKTFEFHQPATAEDWRQIYVD